MVEHAAKITPNSLPAEPTILPHYPNSTIADFDDNKPADRVTLVNVYHTAINDYYHDASKDTDPFKANAANT